MAVKIIQNKFSIMISIQHKLRVWVFLIISAILILSACNKEPEQFTETTTTPPTGATLGETLAATAADSLYFRLVVKSGLLPTLNSKATKLTTFVPDNNSMKLFISAISGGVIPPNAPDAVFSAFI